ncbi:MAG: hypothetical protein ACYDA6_06745, partial [Solirubrobacteraceae bacterium]
VRVKVRSRCLDEPKRTGQSVKDGLGSPVRIAAIKAGVAMDADRCQGCDLLKAESWRAVLTTEGRQSGLLR